MGRSIDLGKIMVTPAGEWARDKNYEILSFVRHDGSGYLAIKNNNGVEPGTDDLIWMLVCERGYTPKLTVDDEGIHNLRVYEGRCRYRRTKRSGSCRGRSKEGERGERPR